MKKPLILLICTLTIFFFNSYGQLSIKGPSCVVAGIQYQYIINGIAPGSTSMQICLSSGVIAGTDSSCHTGSPVTFIRIVWNASSTGSITISGAAGSAVFNVNKTIVFSAGKIDSVSRNQIVNKGVVPVTIDCSDPKGGNCAPTYVYQWQQSVDGMKWTDIPGCLSKRLKFLSPLLATAYYRRKTTETVSHAEQFSDVALVVVNSLTAN